MTNAFEQYQQLGHQAISGGIAVGTFMRDEPEYELLEDEMRKRESMSGEPVDWAFIEERSATLLREKTKDLRVASYLCCALFEQHRHEGLVVGLTILADLVEHYWADAFPALKTGAKALRARQAVLSWFADYLNPRLERAHIADPQQQLAAGAQLARLVTALKAQALELAELFEPTQRYLPEKENATEEATQTTAPPPKPAIPKASSSDDVDLNSPRQVRQSLLKLSTHLLETEPATTLPYHIIYHIAWGEIKNLPQHTEGVTQFSPVSMNRILEYRDMLGAGEYAHLLPKIANSFCNSPFWLNSQYFLATVLDQLGHQRIVKIVEHEVKQFLTKMPQLLDMKFADGTPFADDTTREWLATVLVEEQTIEAEADPQDTTPQTAADIEWLTQLNQTATDDNELNDIIDQANAAALADEFITGLSQLEQYIIAAPNVRSRFIGRLKQAGYCLRHHQAYTAHLQYHQLLDQAKTYQLEAWEPEIVLEAAWGLLRAASAVHGNIAQVPAAQQPQYQQVHALLYRLDTRVAFHFNSFMEAEKTNSPT